MFNMQIYREFAKLFIREPITALEAFVVWTYFKKKTKNNNNDSLLNIKIHVYIDAVLLNIWTKKLVDISYVTWFRVNMQFCRVFAEYFI